MSLLVLFGLAILLVGIAFTWYQLYHLLALDADLRGIPHPKGTAFLLSSGQRGEGLLAYLLYRKRFPLTRISPEKQARSLRLKKMACVGIAIMAVGACVTVIGLSIL